MEEHPVGIGEVVGSTPTPGITIEVHMTRDQIEQNAKKGLRNFGYYIYDGYTLKGSNTKGTFEIVKDNKVIAIEGSSAKIIARFLAFLPE